MQTFAKTHIFLLLFFFGTIAVGKHTLKINTNMLYWRHIFCILISFKNILNLRFKMQKFLNQRNITNNYLSDEKLDCDLAVYNKMLHFNYTWIKITQNRLQCISVLVMYECLLDPKTRPKLNETFGWAHQHWIPKDSDIAWSEVPFELTGIWKYTQSPRPAPPSRSL